MTFSRRIKYGIILLVILASGLALTASTQTWYSLHLADSAGYPTALVVPGSTAAPAIAALSVAGLAFAGALAMAGRIARYILGVLGLVLGVSMTVSVATTMAAPAASGVSVVTKATGIAGNNAVIDLVTKTDATAWPVVALIAGILIVLSAIAVIVTSRVWPAASRRYQAVRLESAGEPPKEPAAASDTSAPDAASARDKAIDSWDELSRGDDPTRE